MKRYFKCLYTISVTGYAIILMSSLIAEYIVNVSIPLNLCLVYAFPFAMLCVLACGIHARLPRQDQVQLKVSRFTLFADHPYCMLARMLLGNLFGIVSMVIPALTAIIWFPIGIGLVAVDLIAFIIVKQREKKAKALTKRHRKLQKNKRHR